MLKKTKFLIPAIVFVIGFCLFALLLFPFFRDNMNLKTAEDNAKSYLINRYGDNEFSVVGVEKDYSYNGFNKYHTGYELEITTPKLNKKLIFRLQDTNPNNTEHVYEEFIENYYEQEVGEYLSQKGYIEFSIRINEENIPNNCGHIPTIDELNEWDAVESITVRLKSDKNSNFDDETERTNTVKAVSDDIVNFLHASKPIVIDVWAQSQSYGYDWYTYDVRASSSAIDLILK